MKWFMAKPCTDCPFSDSPDGVHLRDSLHPDRIPAIKQGLLEREHFICHKTSVGHEQDDDTYGDDEAGRPYQPLICAGARAWQAEQGVVSRMEEVALALGIPVPTHG